MKGVVAHGTLGGHKQTLANPITTSVPKRRQKETHLGGFYGKEPPQRIPPLHAAWSMKSGMPVS